MNSANSAQETEEGEADEGRRRRKEGRKEEEDGAEVNHNTTHRGSGIIVELLIF